MSIGILIPRTHINAKGIVNWPIIPGLEGRHEFLIKSRPINTNYINELSDQLQGLALIHQIVTEDSF